MASMILMVTGAAALVVQQPRGLRQAVRMSSSSEEAASYAIVGCGVPGRGMGWFHGLQLVEGVCPSAKLSDVVEPWFLGGGRESEAGQAFADKCQSEWEPLGVGFSSKLEAGATWAEAGTTKIALIAGRTADNPRLFRDAIAAGATHILLEKPGAPSVAELEAMADFADESGVPVYMGFIKNIAQYVATALEAKSETPGALVTLESLNDYSEANLGECFARNSEGMLKNMAIHELALAATYFDMRADNLVSVTDVDGDVRTIGDYTDFSRVGFTLENDAGARVRIQADRCGGDGCSATVVAPDGRVVAAAKMIDEQRAAKVADRIAQHPEWISYLLTQEDEYRELKERCAQAAIAGTFPAGVATIQTAIHALKLAEYLTPLLERKLAQPAPAPAPAPRAASKDTAVYAR